jgi:hypothetical protein
VVWNNNVPTHHIFPICCWHTLDPNPYSFPPSHPTLTWFCSFYNVDTSMTTSSFSCSAFLSTQFFSYKHIFHMYNLYSHFINCLIFGVLFLQPQFLLSPIPRSYIYILLMPFDMHGLCHSMPPFFSFVLGIPIVKFSIQPSSSLAPYFVWLVLTFLH